MLRKKKDNVKKGAPMWMTTFSDLMTLILVFFILLFAFSEIDATKFRMIANSFRGVFEDASAYVLEYPLTSPVQSNEIPQNLKDKQEAKAKAKKELDELLTKIKKYLKENELEGAIVATREERGVVLVLQENILFDSGRAVVKQQARPFLTKVADLINTLPNLVEVEGHTDSMKIIQPSQYSSNWNLAGDRAANVVNYFVNDLGLASDRFKIAGYADNRPIDTNETDEGRLKNRRVVIVILDYSLEEEVKDS